MIRADHGIMLLEDVNDIVVMLLGMRRGVDPAKWIEDGGLTPESVPSPVAMLM